VLLEIAVGDERARLGPLPVIGERLHKIVDFLKVTDAETLWRLDSDDESKDHASGQPLATDEQLLDGGTLWIPSLGLGLEMLRGQTTTVFLRKPEAAPRRGIGSLTPLQRELSARKNLPMHLVRPRAGIDPLGSWFQKLLTLTLFVAMGLLVWQAIVYQQRWNGATVVEGDVIDVNPGPPDPFPSEYTITYRDQADRPHQVVLKRADVYATPHVGDKVEIRFLPEAPDRPLGPARYRDAAFDKYIPWGIGVMAVYCGLQIVVPLAGLVLGRTKRPTP
jgi:hypothetical protein